MRTRAKEYTISPISGRSRSPMGVVTSMLNGAQQLVKFPA